MIRRIKDIEDLRKLATGNGVDVFISFGILRSSKNIMWCVKEKNGCGGWEVFNEIDGSVAHYNTDKGLERFTNIIKALKTGNLYKHQVQV